MSWLNSTSRRLATGLRLIPRPELIVRRIAEQPRPEEIEPGVIYVVGGKDYQKWAVLRCPNHTDEIMQLSLMPNRRPRWSITADFFERPTINPSVRQLEGSYAHFWVKRGNVTWCADTGKRPSWIRSG